MDAPADAPNPPAKRPWLPLLLIVLLAAGLRLYGIGDSCFWMDEFLSLQGASGRGFAHMAMPRDQWLTEAPAITSLQSAPPAWTIWTSLKLDNYPPLYYLLLRIWLMLFGQSDLNARLLSVALSLAGIVLLHDAVRLGLGRTTANWAAFLTAVALPQIHFGQEARGYVLWSTAGLAACSAIVRIETLGFNGRRAASLIAGVLTMLLTHYFAAASAAAIGLYALLALRGRLRTAAVGSLIAAGVLYAILWGPWLLEQRRNFAGNNEWQRESPPGHIERSLKRAAAIPVRWFNESAANSFPLAAMAIGTAGLVLAATQFRGPKRLWVLYLGLPLLMTFALDLARTTKLLEALRYTVAGGTGLCVVLAGVGLAWRRYVLPVCATALCLVSLPNAYSSAQDWSTVGAYLSQNVRKDDAMVYCSDGWEGWYAGILYIGTTHYAGPPPAPYVLMTRQLSPEISQRLHVRRVVWLIAGSKTPADRLLPGYVVEDSAYIPDIGTVWKLRPVGR